MANTLTNVLPKILARGLMSLRTRCIMPRLVNGDYAADAAKKGTTIDVPVPVAVGTSAVSPSNTLSSPTNLTPGVVQIALDQWYQNDAIALSDKELTEIDENDHFLPMQLGEAVKALATVVNQHIMGKYKGANRGVYGAICNPSDGNDTILEVFGTGTTNTSGVSAATNAKKILNQQLCPRTDRRGLLSFNAEAAALDLSQFSDAEKILSAVVKMEGEVGRKFGIDWVADDDVPSQVVGDAYAASPADITVVGSESVDETAIVIKDVGSGIVKRGDVFTIAGDTQTYTVVGGTADTPSGFYGYQLDNSGISVSINPALKVATSGAEVITLFNSHTVNMVFHRDAFAFATRPLLDNSSKYALGSQMVSMQDPVTGLIMRLEVSRQHKQTVFEYDILWGADLVRAELAMRICGAA